MSTINRIWQTGRLARDPEYKESNGIERCRLVITTEWENKRQNKKEVCFLDCTVWGGEAKLCQQYLKKGSVLAVEGRLKQEKWEDPHTKMQRSKHVLVADTVTFLEKIKINMPMDGDKQHTIVPQPKPIGHSGFNDGAPLKEPPMDEDLPF